MYVSGVLRQLQVSDRSAFPIFLNESILLIESDLSVSEAASQHLSNTVTVLALLLHCKN